MTDSLLPSSPHAVYTPTPPHPARRAMTEALSDELEALQAAGLRRTLRAVHQRRAGTVLLHGERIADFASNDYLGLAADHRVARAATAVLQSEGTGAGAARLISGHHPVHDTLERELALFKGTERALLFPSGYAANIGAIPALVGPDDVIYSDALNHASLIDGCRLSKATLRVFPHCDTAALDAMLQEDAGRYRRALIIVEGVFSMDGDIFPLHQLVEIAERHGAWTYVDDAHGTGVLGATGAGTVEHFGLVGRIDVVMGTLGKALGTSGAFIAGSLVLIEYLTTSARSFIFTTASPPALAAATLEAMRIAAVEPWRRDAVRARARQLRARLKAAGREATGAEDGHVVPIMVGEAVRTMALVTDLRRRGFLVGGVRPPTVPQGTSRMRVSVSALHPPELVDALAASLVEAMRGIVP
ncbi:MAG TPA: 8-amino-7-oxononanoate synthase [Gemmatimonas sp.]|nr:8-amino-7-oxononanoate synthase [Gemmatimonas sp.]